MTFEAYKYVNTKFADDFASGVVRITAAHIFRPLDGQDDGRSDRLELINSASIAGGVEVIDGRHPLLADFFHVVRNGKRIFEDLTVIGESMQIIDNGFLLCLSTTESAEVRASMAEKFNAEAVFGITDLQAFCIELRSIPELRNHMVATGPVSYDAAIEDSVVKMEIPSHFRKRPEFRWQQEWRICWTGEIFTDAFNVELPNLSGLIERIG